MSNQLKKYYGTKKASQYSILPLKAFLSMKNTERVKACLNDYERESGYFDSTGNIIKGHEMYYYYKGDYYLELNLIDSAEYYFRKELEYGKDYNNQNAAAFGLSRIFQLKHKSDSASKYALYAYTMNDSVYSEVATKAMAQSQAMYDYSRHQRQAEQEREKATDAKRLLYTFVILSAFLLFGVAFFASVVVFVLQIKRKNVLIHYHRKVEELAKAQDSLNKMCQHENQSIKQIALKEQKIQELQSELSKLLLDTRLRLDTEKDQLEDSGISKLLNSKSASGKKLSETEWVEIEQFVSEYLPAFHEFLESHKSRIGLSKRRACMLMRFWVGVKGTASMMGVSSTYISRISNEILSDLFHCEGSGKKLIQVLSSIV